MAPDPEELKIRSPKQRRSAVSTQWYSYYAGYSPAFVEDVLDTFGADAESVVDPWNGAGTTTLIASQRTLESLGRDINPALTIVAKGRQTPRSIRDSLLPIARRLAKDATRNADVGLLLEADLLTVWLQPRPASWIRALQQAIHETLVPGSGSSAGGVDPDSLPILAAYFYTATFATVRDALKVFRATNPTWLKQPAGKRQRLRPTDSSMQSAFLDHCARLSEWLTLDCDAQAESALFSTGPAGTPFNARSTYDIAITSPPYCTRIDYVKSSLAELAVLGLRQADIDELRSTTTGSPVVGSPNIDYKNLAGRSARAFEELQAVGKHPSKGSRSYYLPWLSRYFFELDKSIDMLASMIRPDGRICMVVQDSYYKECHLDLQMVTTELAASAGFTLERRLDFEVKQLRSSMNPAARVHRQDRAATESLLVFGR